MKKIVLLTAFTLLGSVLVSCDNENFNSDGQLDTFATDDGLIPPKPPVLTPTLPPPPPPGTKG